MADFVQDEDLLIRYLDGELSGEEKKAVEQRLQTDEGFHSHFTRLQVAVQAIRQLGTTQQVAGVHRQMMQELKVERTSAKVINMRKAVRYTLAVAASVLVLFVGVRLYLNSQVSPDGVYSDTFVYFNVSTSRGNDNNLSTIEKLYQEKNYAGVVSSVHTLQLSAKDSLLTGLSYLYTNKYPDAIRWFHSLTSYANDYRQDAEFYLSLSYLKNKEYGKALPLLESIHQNQSHIYHQQVSDDAVEKVKKLKEL